MRLNIMRNKRRQAVILPIGEPTHLGQEVDAEMGLDNAPKMLGEQKGMYPTMNPFWEDESMLISNREHPESQGEREARLARRLLILLRR